MEENDKEKEDALQHESLYLHDLLLLHKGYLLY